MSSLAVVFGGIDHRPRGKLVTAFEGAAHDLSRRGRHEELRRKRIRDQRARRRGGRRHRVLPVLVIDLARVDDFGRARHVVLPGDLLLGIDGGATVVDADAPAGCARGDRLADQAESRRHDLLRRRRDVTEIPHHRGDHVLAAPSCGARSNDLCRQLFTVPVEGPSATR